MYRYQIVYLANNEWRFSCLLPGTAASAAENRAREIWGANLSDGAVRVFEFDGSGFSLYATIGMD